MRRATRVIALVVALGLWSPLASAEEPDLTPARFDTALEGITYGMTRAAIIESQVNLIKKRYQNLIAAEKDPVQADAYDRRQSAEIHALRGQVFDFTGAISSYDASVIAKDFQKNSGESIFFVERENDRIFYFFSANALWKVALVLSNDTPFDALQKKLEELYGKGKRGAMPKGSAAFTRGWQTKGVRLTLSDERKYFKAYVLRWESRALAATIAETREQVQGDAARTGGPVADENDDILDSAMGPSEGNIDDEVDGILGTEIKPIPDVAGANKKK
jgi:hypothetical protein